MTKKDFLDIFNDIGDEFIDEFANAAQNKKDNDFPLEDFGSPQRPQIIRLERPPKKRASKNISRAPFIAAFTAAAVLVCAVTAGALFKRKDPQTVSPNDSVILSEPASKPAPIIIVPKIRKVEQEGYDFVLEVGEREWISPFSEPFIKTDSSDELAICFNASDASAEYPLYIAFYSQKDIDDPDASLIADLRITRAGMQWHSITYSEKPEPGEKIVMQLSAKTLGRVYIKGRILP